MIIIRLKSNSNLNLNIFWHIYILNFNSKIAMYDGDNEQKFNPKGG